MSKVTQFSDLYIDMMNRLPGITTEKMLLSLRSAGRRFCEESEAFHDDLRPLAIVDYQREYALSTSYNADIHRIIKVKVNANVWDDEYYELRDGNTLRFTSDSIPNNLDDLLLVCGTAGSALIATWQAITNGSVTVDFSDTTYLVEGLDFSDASDMDDVALIIQTGIRTEMDENIGFCRWYTDHFRLWTESGDIGYLTAGTSGTDISGASYMNGLTGVGTLSSLLEVEVVFRPDRDADDLPDWFMDRWQDTIMALAVYQCAKEPKKPWTDKETKQEAYFDYRRGLAMAKQENYREFKSVEPCFRA